uniref:Transcription factor IIIB 60 kDa subunit n=1 Tax=Rhizophora mucronata TaxID=61149 RepID=A0A2P2M7M1_RHIMU
MSVKQHCRSDWLSLRIQSLEA